MKITLPQLSAGPWHLKLPGMEVRCQTWGVATLTPRESINHRHMMNGVAAAKQWDQEAKANGKAIAATNATLEALAEAAERLEFWSDYNKSVGCPSEENADAPLLSKIKAALISAGATIEN